MNTVHQIINEIIQQGAKFSLYGGDVSLTKEVDTDLLERARKHKNAYKHTNSISIANTKTPDRHQLVHHVTPAFIFPF